MGKTADNIDCEYVRDFKSQSIIGQGCKLALKVGFERVAGEEYSTVGQKWTK